MNMHKRTFLTTILLLLVSCYFAVAQNCGNVTDFKYTIQDNGNGTSTYNFSVTIQATSGGSKSVNLSIACGGYNFVTNQCEASQATTRVVSYGPYTISTCSGEITLLWSGHSNAACGGTTCNPLQYFAPLPVELTSFKAEAKGRETMLKWTTATEQNNQKFVVERSEDGTSFREVGEVSGMGTTQEAQSYSFMDEKPFEGLNYYRLKQIDFDGNYEYTEVKSVVFHQDGEILIYPTVVSDAVQVLLPKEFTNSETNIAIYALQGTLLLKQTSTGDANIQIGLAALPAGQYLAVVSNGSLSKRSLIVKL
ncbi:MAG: T9SS type A sorting domain-containing protein [Bacteroidetes bacterium]|nr:T9SS type A sorting domain-containing protein [Bacteroidota bacterium]